MQYGGYLYIITCNSFPDWVKIGTTKNLEDRIHTYQTCSPFRDYKVVYSLFHPKYKEAEKKIKDTMKPFALEIKNEWYKIHLHMAKSRLEEQLEEYNSTS